MTTLVHFGKEMLPSRSDSLPALRDPPKPKFIKMLICAVLLFSLRDRIIVLRAKKAKATPKDF